MRSRLATVAEMDADVADTAAEQSEVARLARQIAECLPEDPTPREDPKSMV